MTDLGPASPPSEISQPSSKLHLGILVAGLAILGMIGIYTQRGWSFMIDEWVILARYHDGHFLTPYNGHLSLVPVVIYQALARTAGLSSYRMYGLVAITFFLAIPLATFLTHRRRVDQRLLVIATLGIAFGWAAHQNLLYGMLLIFDLPLVILIASAWLLRLDTPRADYLISALLAIALATSSVGIVVTFAVGVELVARRSSLRRMIRFAPPIIAWAIWYLGNNQPVKTASIGAQFDYGWTLLVSILSGFTVGWRPGAAIVGLALITILGIAHFRWQALDAHAVALLATLGFFVVLTAYSRAGDIGLNSPSAPRYIFFGNVLLILTLLWCVRDRPIDTPTLGTIAVVVIAGAIGFFGHLGPFRSYELDYRARTQPYLAASEAAHDRARADRVLPLNMIPVTVREYLGIVDAGGSPTAGIPPQRLGTATDRRQADRLLVKDEKIRVEPASSSSRCAGPSRSIPRQGLRVEPGSSWLIRSRGSSMTEITIRRFGPPGSGVGIGEVSSTEAVKLQLEPDRSPLPWWIGAHSAVSVCETTTG